MKFVHITLLSTVFATPFKLLGSNNNPEASNVNRVPSDFSLTSLLNPDGRLASGLNTPMPTPRDFDNEPNAIPARPYSSVTAFGSVRPMLQTQNPQANSRAVPATPNGSICLSSATASSSSGSSPSPESEPTPAQPFILPNNVSLAAVAAGVGASYSKFVNDADRADDLLHKGYNGDMARLKVDLLSVDHLIEQKKLKELNEVLVRLKSTIDEQQFNEFKERIGRSIAAIENALESERYSHGAPSAPKRRCAASRVEAGNSSSGDR